MLWRTWRVQSRCSRSSSARDCEGSRTETAGDRSGQRRIPPERAEPKARSTLISPTAVPACRAWDHPVRAQFRLLSGPRLHLRRLPEIDDVDSTWLRSSLSDEDLHVRISVQ